MPDIVIHDKGDCMQGRSTLTCEWLQRVMSGFVDLKHTEDWNMVHTTINPIVIHEWLQLMSLR